MLNLIIQTQYKENYAAHDEDYVHGVSESYWKFKGGSSYLITDIDFINTEFDKKFESGQDMTGDLDFSKARRVNQEAKRVNIDFPVWVL